MKPTIDTRGDLVRALQRERVRIRGLGVDRLGVFGSFARDEQTPESDVDLLVAFRPGEKSFDRFMALVEVLEASLDRRVELVTRESLSPYIGPRILREVQDVEI